MDLHSRQLCFAQLIPQQKRLLFIRSQYFVLRNYYIMFQVISRASYLVHNIKYQTFRY